MKGRDRAIKTWNDVVATPGNGIWPPPWIAGIAYEHRAAPRRAGCAEARARAHPRELTTTLLSDGRQISVAVKLYTCRGRDGGELRLHASSSRDATGSVRRREHRGNW
jgi:hypothetical protein